MNRWISNFPAKLEALGNEFARLPVVVQAVIPTILAVFLNLSTLTLGFLTDDYWLLDGVVHRGVVLTGQWVQGLSYYRPLVTLSLFLNYRMFGTFAGGFHATNILVHALNAFVLYIAVSKIVRIVSKDRMVKKSVMAGTPLLLTLLFVVHPANAHDVAWISGRTDLIAGLFMILSLFFFLKTEEGVDRISTLLSIVAFVLALGTKEIAYVTPFLLVVISVELALLRREDKASAGKLGMYVLKGIRRCAVFFAVDILYMVVRFAMFHFSEPVANLSTVGIRELVLFIARAGFLLVSPIDPLSAVNVFVLHPIAVATMCVLMVVMLVYIVVSRRSLASSRFLQTCGVVIVGVTCLIVPYLTSVSIAQRLMYVPIMFSLVLLAPIVLSMESHEDRWNIRSLSAFVFLLVLLGTYGSAYHYNIVSWKEASEMENSLVKEIVQQTDDPHRPIVIINYPQRVGQANILYYLPCRLYFAFAGSFGTADSVYTGFCMVPSSFQTAGKGIIFAPEDSTLHRFIFTSENPLQFFYPDPYGIIFEHGIPIREAAVGQSVGNRLLIAKVIKVNETHRMTSCEAEIIHPSILTGAQMFIFQDGHMKRLR